MIAMKNAQWRLFLAADVFCIQAPRVKAATGRRIDGAGNIAF